MKKHLAFTLVTLFTAQSSLFASQHDLTVYDKYTKRFSKNRIRKGLIPNEKQARMTLAHIGDQEESVDKGKRAGGRRKRAAARAALNVGGNPQGRGGRGFGRNFYR